MAKKSDYKADRMATLAMRFWREVEAPSEGIVWAVFHLLAERNEEALAELVELQLRNQ